jgi:hypothetical protein
MPPRIATRTRRRLGRSTRCGSSVAIRTEAIDPARYWPCPPMLKRPQRKAKATARPTRTRAVQRSSVCSRFAADCDARSSVFHGNQTRALEKGTPIS